MATLAERQADAAELDAYNGAFWDLGFRWQWDASLYRELCDIAGEQERVRGYITRHHSHLLAAYDADALARVIVENKRRRLAVMQAARAAGCRSELSCAGMLEA